MDAQAGSMGLSSDALWGLYLGCGVGGGWCLCVGQKTGVRRVRKNFFDWVWEVGQDRPGEP